MIQKETVASIAKKYSLGQVCVVFPFGVPSVTLDDNLQTFALFLTISKKKEFHLRLINPETFEEFLSFQLKQSCDVQSNGNILFIFFGEHTLRSDPSYPLNRFSETTSRLLDKVIRYPPKKYRTMYIIGEELLDKNNDKIIKLPINSEVEILREYENGLWFVRSPADNGETGFIRMKCLGEEKRKGDLSGFQSIIIDQQESVLRRMVALQTYEAQRDDELSIKKDDLITIHEESEQNWWRGECNGKVGLFPISYCNELGSEESRSDIKEMVPNIESLSDTVIIGDPRKRRFCESNPNSPIRVVAVNKRSNKPKRSPPPKPKENTSNTTHQPPPSLMSELQDRLKQKQDLKKPTTAPPSPPKHDIGPDPHFGGNDLLEELSNRLHERKNYPAAPLIQLTEQDENTSLALQEGDMNNEVGINIPLVQVTEQNEGPIPDLQETSGNDMIGQSGFHLGEMIEQYEVLIKMKEGGELNPSFLVQQSLLSSSSSSIENNPMNNRRSLSVMSIEEKKTLVEHITSQLVVLENLKFTLFSNYQVMKKELELGQGDISPNSKKRTDRKSLRVTSRFRNIVKRYENLIREKKKESEAAIKIERKKRVKEVMEIEDELKYVTEMISVFSDQKNIIKSSYSK